METLQASITAWRGPHKNGQVAPSDFPASGGDSSHTLLAAWPLCWPRDGWPGESWQCLWLGELGQQGQRGESFLCSWSHTIQDNFIDRLWKESASPFRRVKPSGEAQGFRTSETLVCPIGQVVERYGGFDFVADGASCPDLTESSLSCTELWEPCVLTSVWCSLTGHHGHKSRPHTKSD